jgi:hypothetical protein
VLRQLERLCHSELRRRCPAGAAHLSLAVGLEDALHVQLYAHDRLDAGLLAGLVEADGAVQPVVIGAGRRRHAGLGGGLHQLVDTAGAVAEREVGVDVQMNERRRLRHTRGLPMSESEAIE